MAYKVRLTRPAEADAYAAYEYIRGAAPHSSDTWLSALFAAIDMLADMPTRCPVIPEADDLHHQARQLLFGKRNGFYRIIFDIQEASEEGPRVRVLRIWHGSRDVITASDFETAIES